MKRQHETAEARVISIVREKDVVQAREFARALGREVGFKGAELVRIANVVSEVACRIMARAKSGEVAVAVIRDLSKHGLQVVVRVQGLRIPDVSRIMRNGCSMAGLTGARRRRDEFAVVSRAGTGTSVILRKWPA
jgi:anti-sigma regulatory factor (Ser/Thr protein kinase)